jgi:hypothetical protein
MVHSVSWVKQGHINRVIKKNRQRLASVLIFGIVALASVSPALAGLPGPSAEMFHLSGPSLNAFLQRSWTKAEQLPGVVTGPKTGPNIVVFFDPNCPFCAHLWHRIQAWHDYLRIRWIPVAFIRRESLNMAVSILNAKHPRQALNYNEKHYNFVTRRGAVLPMLQVSPAQSAVIQDNTAFWRQRFDITPMILYQTPNGVRGMFGLPDKQHLQMIYRNTLRICKMQDQKVHRAPPYLNLPQPPFPMPAGNS